jgi:two-component sensor histidine kinase
VDNNDERDFAEEAYNRAEALKEAQEELIAEMYSKQSTPEYSRLTARLLHNAQALRNDAIGDYDYLTRILADTAFIVNELRVTFNIPK